MTADGHYRTFGTHNQVSLDYMQIQPFPWKSLFLAPFASVPVLTLAGLGSSDAGAASDFGWGIFFGLLLAVPASFVAMLLIGVPVFLILRPHKYALMLTTCAAGFAIPFQWIVQPRRSLWMPTNALERLSTEQIASFAHCRRTSGLRTRVALPS